MQSACAADEASDNVAFCLLLKQNKKQVLKHPLTLNYWGNTLAWIFFLPGTGHTNGLILGWMRLPQVSQQEGRGRGEGRCGLWWERGQGTAVLPSASLLLLVVSPFP